MRASSSATVPSIAAMPVPSFPLSPPKRGLANITAVALRRFMVTGLDEPARSRAAAGLASRANRGLAAKIDRHSDVGQVVSCARRWEKSAVKSTSWTAAAPFLFVGREDELACLHSVWETVRGGAARVVGIEGDPGIGKTLLVRRFLAAAGPAAVVWASGDEAEAQLPWGVVSQMAGALPGWPDGFACSALG